MSSSRVCIVHLQSVLSARKHKPPKSRSCLRKNAGRTWSAKCTRLPFTTLIATTTKAVLSHIWSAGTTPKRSCWRDLGSPLTTSAFHRTGRCQLQEKTFSCAAAWLRRGLRLDPTDAYANDFLGTIYFLEGNLEAPEVLEPDRQAADGVCNPTPLYVPRRFSSIVHLHFLGRVNCNCTNC